MTQSLRSSRYVYDSNYLEHLTNSLRFLQETNELSVATTSKKRTRDGRVKLSSPAKRSKTNNDKDAPRIEYLTYKVRCPSLATFML
jgi:hypothetical protein